MTASRNTASVISALLALSLSCGSYALAGERNDANNLKTDDRDQSLFSTILHEEDPKSAATQSEPSSSTANAVPASTKKSHSLHMKGLKKSAQTEDASIDPEDLKVLKEVEESTNASSSWGLKSQTPKLDENKETTSASKTGTNQSAASSKASSNADLSSATLQGKVSTIDPGTTVPGQIDRITDIALKENKDAQRVQKLVDKYNTKTQKTVVFAKEMAYAMVPYRGFGPSKEGSQILLERVKKIKTLAAAEYFKQRIEDETHTRVVGRMLEIAMGLDEPNKERSQQMISSGYEHLKKLVGEEEAQKTLDTITAWSKSLNVPKTAFEQAPIDVDDFQTNIKDTTLTAVHGDPVMRDTIRKVRKFNKGPAMVALSSVVESGSALACLFGPGLLIPVGVELANAGFVAGTGGCEETKLVNQMYIGKRMESRWRRLNEETTLAITNYQTALRTKSPTLLACSEAVIEQLVGADKVSKVLGQTVLASKDRGIGNAPIQTAERPMQDVK